jgi:hypothetical protein|eukprot:COSAG01_NODE_2134_length_8347_cov_43.066319_8_plen_119_part_00
MLNYDAEQVLPAEIFPMRLKEKALALSVCSQYASNFLLLQLFPVVTAWIGAGGSCLWFAANMGIAGARLDRDHYNVYYTGTPLRTTHTVACGVACCEEGARVQERACGSGCRKQLGYR